MNTKLAALAACLAMSTAFSASRAQADQDYDRGLNNSGGISTQNTDPSSSPDSSGKVARHHSQASIGVGAIGSTNDIQGASAGVAAQLKFRFNGRGTNPSNTNDREHPSDHFDGYHTDHDEGNPNFLYDQRMSLTYNVISSGPAGASTNLALRNQSMFGWAALDPRNNCSFYGGFGGYAYGSIATPNSAAASSFRGFFGPETGLACDVSGVLLTLSPSVGIGGAENAQTGLTTGNVGGAGLMAGGVARVSMNDRLHVAARMATSLSSATNFSNNPSANSTMVGLDADYRISDRWTVGLDIDTVHYANDPGAASGAGIPCSLKNEGVAIGTISTVF